MVDGGQAAQRQPFIVGAKLRNGIAHPHSQLFNARRPHRSGCQPINIAARFAQSSPHGVVYRLGAGGKAGRLVMQ
jgi:hypothetical protein